MTSAKDLDIMNSMVMMVVKPFPAYSPPLPSFQKGGENDVSYVGAQRAKMTWTHTTLDTYDEKTHLTYQEALNKWAHCPLPCICTLGSL